MPPSPDVETAPDRDRNRRLRILGAVVGAMFVVAAFLPRIPQDPAYHRFADARCLCGVPNAFDVWSNAPFVVVGVLGLYAVRRGGSARFRDPAERPAWIVAFAGIAATGFGSACYHLAPTNETLVWDRLPMTVVFAAVVATQIGERVGAVAGRRLLVPLLLFGAATVFYWGATETRGVGDLRWYGLMQFGPILFIPTLWALFPRRYDRLRDFGFAAAWYAVAKITEATDRPIFEGLGGVVSGHTIKHLAAAAATAAFLIHVVRRVPVDPIDRRREA